jgi:hypothetical protein
MKYITIKIPKLFIIILLAIPILYYIYGCYRFEKRVQAYNEIQEGDHIIMVLAKMGKPSHYDDLYYIKEGNEEKRAILVIYEGFYYLRDSIVLIFDYRTERLVRKERIAVIFRQIQM